MTLVAALLVTKDSTVHLEETLDSIRGQSRSPDFMIAIDDRSTDGTVNQLHAAGFDVRISTSSATDVPTRIAQNFVQGIRFAQLRGADFAILGDHDDIWHRDRIAHQLEVLEAESRAAMVASDGFLMNEHGVAIPGTIRGTFPVPEEFGGWTVRRQLRYALRHSIATGGASALRLSGLSQWSVPWGWLHDRWWSLAAVREHAFIADEAKVIDYRISDEQQVGLTTSGQDRSFAWWSSQVRRAGRSVGRSRDVVGLLRS